VSPLTEGRLALKPVVAKHELAVIGVAPDSQTKLANFRKKNRLPWRDPERARR
jgi:hypothetical protein